MHVSHSKWEGPAISPTGRSACMHLPACLPACRADCRPCHFEWETCTIFNGRLRPFHFVYYVYITYITYIMYNTYIAYITYITQITYSRFKPNKWDAELYAKKRLLFLKIPIFFDFLAFQFWWETCTIFNENTVDV